MIIAENLTKTYNRGSVRALDNVSLKIEDGEFVVILGASGSGKSTVLSVLSGLERPDGGIVKCGDTELNELSDSNLTEFRRKRVGFIFQQYYLLPHLSVKSNVKLGADLTANKNYIEIIKSVGLENKLNRRPSELSGGEQQRVCIARALAKLPEFLFLDEPTGALDEKTGREILDYILKLKKECGFTMIMVTHNSNIAEMADKVIRMNSGKVVETYDNESPKNAYEIGW